LEILQRLSGELGALARSTEVEFLSIGEDLQHFQVDATEISKTSQSVAHLMSGERIATIVDGFREVIDRIRRMEGDSEQNVEALQRVLENLAEQERLLGGFHKTVRSLRVLRVSIRIESARLGEKDIGFSDLAEEVAKLALEIGDRCSQLLARSELLRHQIGQTLVSVRNLENNQHTQAGVMLDKTMSSLESITEKQVLSSEGAKHIATRYDVISRNIWEIVSSMQFHDITRQRLEHAREALYSLAGDHGRVGGTDLQKEDERGTAKGNGGKDDARRLFLGGIERWRHSGEAKEPLLMAGGVCELQVAQLRHAKDELTSAVKNIIINLRGMATQVAEMSLETREMAGTAGETGRSSLAEIEGGFASVIAALSSYADANRVMSLLMASVGRALGDMSAYIASIEGIGAKIKLIALNAVVKASHIGNEGETLGLLAEGIHGLSVETCRQTETASEVLRSITSTSTSLCAGVGADGEANNAEVAHVEQTLRTLLNALKDINLHIVSLLTRINEEGLALSDQILRTIEGVSVNRKVSAVIDNVVSRLSEIVTLSTSQNLTESQPDVAERMKALEASYTMQGEREVHQSMVTAGAVLEKSFGYPQSPPILGESTALRSENNSQEEIEEDLGDNVELF
jgi:methyl-accepting chemotaxis protein